MIKRLAFIVSAAVLAAMFIRTFVIETVYVASASMEPTLKVGELMLEEKISRWLVKPKRGEIIVFKSPVDEKELIKRVIAVAGDTVEIKEKEVFINGAPAKEDYVKHTRASELLSGDNINRLTVPASTVFVMGDNRDESNDSRDWINSATGEHIYFLPLSNIKGRVIRIN